MICSLTVLSTTGSYINQLSIESATVYSVLRRTRRKPQGSERPVAHAASVLIANTEAGFSRGDSLELTSYHMSGGELSSVDHIGFPIAASMYGVVNVVHGLRASGRYTVNMLYIPCLTHSILSLPYVLKLLATDDNKRELQCRKSVRCQVNRWINNIPPHLRLPRRTP